MSARPLAHAIAGFAALLVTSTTVTAQSTVFRGRLAEPPRSAVTITVRFGGQQVPCKLSAAQPDALCEAAIPADYAAARLEIAAEGYSTWTKNVFLDTRIVDVGTIQLQKAAPKDLVVTAARLRIRGSRDFLIETVAENLSAREVPIRRLVLESETPWNVKCRESAPVNPWQPLTFDWGVARNPGASPVDAWTRLRGADIQVQVRFRPANCGDYNHRLEATVPLDVTVPASGVERIVLRITEVNRSGMRGGQADAALLESLSEWETMTVTLHAVMQGTAVVARSRVQ
jgi:hypothetical protein